MVNTSQTQSEIVADRINRLKPNITKIDKIRCMEEFNMTAASTLWRYLNGRFADTDKAIEIYEFFHKRIQKRSDALLMAEV